MHTNARRTLLLLLAAALVFSGVPALGAQVDGVPPVADGDVATLTTAELLPVAASPRAAAAIPYAAGDHAFEVTFYNPDTDEFYPFSGTADVNDSGITEIEVEVDPDSYNYALDYGFVFKYLGNSSDDGYVFGALWPDHNSHIPPNEEDYAGEYEYSQAESAYLAGSILWDIDYGDGYEVSPADGPLDFTAELRSFGASPTIALHKVTVTFVEPEQNPNDPAPLPATDVPTVWVNGEGYGMPSVIIEAALDETVLLGITFGTSVQAEYAMFDYDESAILLDPPSKNRNDKSSYTKVTFRKTGEHEVAVQFVDSTGDALNSYNRTVIFNVTEDGPGDPDEGPDVAQTDVPTVFVDGQAYVAGDEIAVALAPEDVLYVGVSLGTGNGRVMQAGLAMDPNDADIAALEGSNMRYQEGNFKVVAVGLGETQASINFYRPGNQGPSLIEGASIPLTITVTESGDLPDPDPVADIDNLLDEIEQNDNLSAEYLLDVVGNIDGLADMELDTGTISKLKQLEDHLGKAGIKTDIVQDNYAAGLFGNASIEVIGAALNLQSTAADKTVQLSFREPQAILPVSDPNYSNMVQLDITLHIAGAATALKLHIPVIITLPIPDGVSADNLRILHFTGGGANNFEVITPTVNTTNNTCTFTVNGFSTFAFANYAEPQPEPPTNPSDDDGGSGGGGGGGGGESTGTAPSGPASVMPSAAIASVNTALAAARQAGLATAAARLVNPGDISLAALQAMVRQAGTVPLSVYADSMNGSAVDVRITFNPAQATSALNLSASTRSLAAVSTTARFEQYYSNNVMTVALGQQDSFGMPVEVAARLQTGLNTANLVFYAYDRRSNTYSPITNPAYWVDENGYVHFTTTLGGIIVISNGELSRKESN